MSLPPLNLDLTLAQQFLLNQIENCVQEFPREDLENAFLQIIKQKMILNNSFKALIKNTVDQDFKNIAENPSQN